MAVPFVHLADVHIGKSFASTSFGHELGIRRRAEIKQTFFDVLDGCEENGIPLLLISGDLFEDAYLDMSDLKDVQRRFESLSNTQIFICAGNHDPIISDGSSYRLVNWSPNVHIFNSYFEKFSLPEYNIDIYGMSWNKKEIKQMSLDFIQIEDPEKTNILMLHADIFTDSPYLPVDIYELLEKGFDYIALGHIHKPFTEDSGYAYPGSLEPLDFSEVGPHGIIEGEIDGKRIVKRFTPMSRRNFEVKRITVSPEQSFEEIKAMALEEINKDIHEENMYRLIIEGIKDEAVNIKKEVIEELLETRVYYCEVIDETQSNYDLDRIKRDNSDNLIGEFIKYMEEKGLDNPQVKDALYEGLNILLSEKVNG